MSTDLSLTPFAHELAVLLSSAAFIDPQLLRRLRLKFLPDADARAESRVWWSDIVEHRGGNGLTFTPEALDALRDELENRGDLADVLAEVRDHHEGGPPLLVLEEKLIATDLVDKDLEKIDACLALAIAELERGRREEVFAWAERSLPRFPRRARASNAAWTLSLALHQRFGIPLVVDAAPTALKWQQLSRWLPDQKFDVALELFLEEDDLMVRAERTTSQVIRVPATDPLVLVVERGGSSESVSIPRDATRRLCAAGETVTIANLRGQRWRARVEATQLEQLEQLASDRLPAALHVRQRPRFRWLHLSDLLIGPGRLATDIDRVIATATKDGPIDAVFVTGDLTMSGAPDEYDVVAAVLEELMRKLPQADRVPRIFLVPGNHDADRRAYADADSYIARWHEDEEFRERFWSGEGPFRSVVRQAFSGWTQRWKSPTGQLPGDFAATFSVGELRVGVIGLNNVFLAAYNKSYGHQDLDPRQLAAVCPDGLDRWAEAHDLRILLTHYPPAALHPRAQAAFEQVIAPPGRFHLHLAGSHHFGERVVAQPQSLLWIGSPHWDREMRQAYDVGQLEADRSEFRVSIVAAPESPRAEPKRFTLERSSRTRQDLLVTSEVIPDSGVWVLVDGANQFELPPEQVELAKQLGETLARDGHSMITFGTQGVAHVAARAFMRVLKIQGYTSGIYRLLHLVPDGERADFFESGRTLFPQSRQSVVAAALQRANVAVTIGDSSLSSELFALAALAQVPAVALLDGGMQRGIELPAFWKWKTSSDRATFISSQIGERMGIGELKVGGGDLMRSLTHAAALALDERDLDDYNRILERLGNREELWSVVDGLLRDRRPSHRLLGYLWIRKLPDDTLLLDALQHEHDAVRDFWETRTLWFALDEFRRSPRELDVSRARSFAALLVMIQRLILSNRRIDPGGEIKRILDRVARQFEDHVVGRSGAMQRADRIADRALEYEELRAQSHGPERTRRLDELANQVSKEFPDATARESRAWFASGAAGNRVIALALVHGSLDEQGDDIVIDAIQRPISGFEHYRALLVGLSLIGRLAAVQQERLLMAVEAEVAELGGDTGRLALARQIMRAVEHARSQRARGAWIWISDAATPAPELIEGTAPHDVVPADLVVVLAADLRLLGLYQVGPERRVASKGSVIVRCQRQVAFPDADMDPSADDVGALVTRARSAQLGWASGMAAGLVRTLVDIYAEHPGTVAEVRRVFAIEEDSVHAPVPREPRVWLHSRGRRGGAMQELEIVGSATILAGDLVVLFAERRPVGVYTVVSGRRNLDPETLHGRTITAQCQLALEIPPPKENFLDANRREIDNLAKTTAERDTRALGIHDRLVTLLTKLCADDPELSSRVAALLG